MVRCILFLANIPLISLILAAVCSADEPVPELVRVQLILRGEHFKAADVKPLLEMGERAFPAYEIIIGNPESDPTEVARAFGIIGQVKGSRSRFIDSTVARLADSNRGVRTAALGLLGRIGSERDTAPIIALLSDEDLMVRTAAADTLPKIGGKRDLVAMDAWLKTGASHRNDGNHLLLVKKCRDELEKRLKENPIPKDLKN